MTDNSIKNYENGFKSRKMISMVSMMILPVIILILIMLVLMISILIYSDKFTWVERGKSTMEIAGIVPITTGDELPGHRWRNGWGLVPPANAGEKHREPSLDPRVAPDFSPQSMSRWVSSGCFGDLCDDSLLIHRCT